jgi:enoyl-CoA hydratase
MTTRSIRVEDGARTRRILIERPDKANALTAEMMHALAAAVREAPGDIVAIEGRSPRGFSAGADIAEFLQGGEHLQRQEAGLKDIVDSFVASSRPILAVVHGRTLGAGVLVAGLCDLVIAADDLQFGLPEIRFNMYPVVVHAVLEEKIAPALAFQLCATGRLLDAQEARSLGLVSDIVAAARFATEAADRVAFYEARAEALSIGRRALRALRRPAVDERIARLAPLMHENFHRPGVRDTIARYFRG